MGSLAKYFKIFLDVAVFKYPFILIGILTIIFGLILSNKIDDIGRGRQFMGCVIAVAGVVIEWFLPAITAQIPKAGVYIGSTMGAMIIRFVMIVLAFKMFSHYKISTGVVVIFVIALVVYLGRTVYYSQVLYNMNNLMSGVSKGKQAFLDLFNNKSALTWVTLFAVLVPPIAVYVDAFSNAKKYIVES